MVALAAVLFLPAVWNRDLWDPDEPTYAEVTRQMRLHGDLLVPRFNGKIYSEKPPLFFWLSLAAEHLPGLPEGAGGRLVGALASCGTLLITWRIGALLMGEATGFLASCLLGGCVLFWNLAQSGVIDPLLAFLTTTSLYGFARHLRAMPGGLIIFYGSASLAVLAKGPVGLIVPALAALATRLLDGGPRGLLAAHPLWGLPLAAAPALAWLLLATRRAGPEYLQTMLVRQNLGRAVQAYIHREPFWYYALVAPLVLMPLTIFLPSSLAAAWKERICGIRPMLLPLSWFGTTLLFFSAVSSKKTRYMLVLAPAAALLVAGWIMRRYLDSGRRIREGRLLLASAGILFVLIATVLALPAAGGPAVVPRSAVAQLQDPASLNAREALERALTWPGNLRILLPSAVLMAAGAWSVLLSLHRRPESLTVLLGGWLSFLAIAGAAWPPLLDPIKSARPLAGMVRRHMPSGPLYLLDSGHPPGLNFYLGRDSIPTLRGREERIAASRIPGAGFFGNRSEMDRQEKKTGIRFHDRHCRRLGGDVECLASATAPPAEPAEPIPSPAPGR